MLDILIADDSKTMRLHVTRVVRSIHPDANVLYAASGAEVIKVWRAGAPPALTILDIHMPDLTGLDLLRQFSADGGKPPRVVIYTASRDEAMRRDCLDAGAIAVATKAHDDIAGAIRQALPPSVPGAPGADGEPRGTR